MAPTIAAHPYAVDDRTNCQSEADRDDLATKANESVGEDGQHSESVHVCPNCGQVINLAELDMRAITTGIVTCSACNWSGQIEIQVIDQVPRKGLTSAE